MVPKFTKPEKNSFILCTVLSMLLHFILAVFLYYSYTVKNKNNISKLANKKKLTSMDIELTNQYTKTSKQPFIQTPQEKLNKIKILEDITPMQPVSQPSIQTPQEKLNKIKILEDITPMQPVSQPSIQTPQEKLNKIKILEDITPMQPVSQPSIQTPQEKLNKIKILEDITPMQPVSQPSIQTPQEKKPHILPNTKKITNESNLNYLLNKFINNNENLLQLKNINIKSINNTKFYEQEYQSKLDAINLYKIMITQSIINKFYNNTNFSGKQCTLHITLEDNDTTNIIKSFEGNFELCQAAISAVKLAEIPKPPDSEIGEIFKNITLNFTP
ncbi:cell envelope integrity TolA C-terminal domain-containing protein [Blochmannia endosymbiont of Polyrhachis (Hedomyrma) turneri]|uniref:cell envelope integrity TolA C-terminal domain-containing protein n=1 Tax=Blochmannia endosymbiont of Polyrhachis (Hedomyrma) turneri TaxID=1505596 RepID=UPI00061A7F05|nr:cell envelope integrity TolA C-terminal domain-containing protein [Blochmannia endosymbiont of Polyrhachis (Hedomyrma) turneri]AKC59906.1 protein TolA [Blochmannia endosymbiont of Polyrhachis (Hedomyrma) turneri]